MNTEVAYLSMVKISHVGHIMTKAVVKFSFVYYSSRYARLLSFSLGPLAEVKSTPPPATYTHFMPFPFGNIFSPETE